jgi:hypothetical protein
MSLARVDFPEPDRPTMATVVPAGISKERLERVGASWPGA